MVSVYSSYQSKSTETQVIKNRLSSDMPRLCESLGLIMSKRVGNSFRFGTHGSLSVVVRGQDAGNWFDHEACEGGGPIDLIMRKQGLSFTDARQWALNWLGGDIGMTESRSEPVPKARRANPNKEAALRIWDDCEPLGGTIGQSYLRRRAIDILPSGDVARFHPCLSGTDGTRRIIAPAIVMLVRDIETGEPIGIQRRYLTDDGKKHPLFPKPKSLGRTKGGAIMVTGFKAPNGLNVCEGFEDALSLICLGLDGGVWSLCGTSGLKNFTPLHRVRTIRIIADNDQAGIERAKDCALRWIKAGHGAVWQTLGDAIDPNAVLMKMRGVQS